MLKFKSKVKAILIILIGMALISGLIIYSYFLNTKNSYIYTETENLNSLSNQLKAFIPEMNGLINDTNTVTISFDGKAFESLNEVFDKFKLVSETQTNMLNNQSITKSNINYDGESLGNTEIIIDNSNYYLRLNDLYEKYFGYDVTNFTLPKQSDLSNINEDTKNIIKEYGNFIIQNIDDKDVTYNGKCYTISFEGINEIVDKVLEKIENDTKSNQYLLTRLKNAFTILDKLDNVIVSQDENGVKMFPMMNVYVENGKIIKREICTAYGDKYTPIYNISTYEDKKAKKTVGFLFDEEEKRHIIDWEIKDKAEIKISWEIDQNEFSISFKQKQESNKITYDILGKANIKEYDLSVKVNIKGEMSNGTEFTLPQITSDNSEILNYKTVEEIKNLQIELWVNWQKYLKGKESIYNKIVDELVKVVLNDSTVNGETVILPEETTVAEN